MAQVNRISSFKSFTEVKNQETTMKLRETNNAKRQETVGKIGAILDEMGLTSLSELDEEKKQALINKMFGNVSEDEAEDIEDEINKLGEPKKLEEGNAFIYADNKAKQEGKSNFEFNGKTYKVTIKKDTGLSEKNEGNAFGAAVKKAKEDDEDEFEVDDKTYKVEESIDEAKRTTFTGKTAHDLYTQTGGKPVTVYVKNDWYSVDPKELKDNKGDSFTGYSKDGSDYGFDLKDIKFIQESVESIDEARSIAKIQYDWSKLTTSMQATAQNWKAAEGSAKEALLGKLKEMTAQKKALEAELDATIADKDKDLELVVSESFYRLPKDVIGTELYVANQSMQSLYSGTAAGNDISPKEIDFIIKNLQQVKSLAKKFNKAEEVIGTVYEGEVNEAEKFKSTKDFLDFLEEIDGMPENRIKRIMGKDYIDTPGGFRDEADDYDNDIEDYTISNMGKSDFNKLKTWWENNVQESTVVESGFHRSAPSAEATRRAEQLKTLKKLRDHKEEQDRIKKAQLKRAKADGSAKESVVAEGKDDYMAKFGSANINLKKGYKHHTEDELNDLYDKLGDLVKTLNVKDVTLVFESTVTEAEVQSDDEFKEYAMTVLKKAFGDEFDEAKAGEVVDGILKKCGDDYGACVGMLTASLGESATNEAFDANYWEDYHDKSQKITSASKVEGAVEDGVWDWNDNNENGKENEVTSAGEKKVMKLAKDFFKAKGYICADIIDAMIAQES